MVFLVFSLRYVMCLFLLILMRWKVLKLLASTNHLLHTCDLHLLWRSMLPYVFRHSSWLFAQVTFLRRSHIANIISCHVEIVIKFCGGILSCYQDCFTKILIRFYIERWARQTLTGIARPNQVHPCMQKNRLEDEMAHKPIANSYLGLGWVSPLNHDIMKNMDN